MLSPYRAPGEIQSVDERLGELVDGMTELNGVHRFLAGLGTAQERRTLGNALRRALFPKIPSRVSYLTTLIFCIALATMNMLYDVAVYELARTADHWLSLLLVSAGCTVFGWLFGLWCCHLCLETTEFGQFAYLPKKYIMGEAEARMVAWAKKKHASPASIESILEAYRRYLSKKIKDRTEVGENLVVTLHAMMDEMGIPAVSSLVPPLEVSGVRIQADTAMRVEEASAEPSTTVIPKFKQVDDLHASRRSAL